MTEELQCCINFKGCKNKANYVCHHCGRPLCDGSDCCRWGWDFGFVGYPIAYHCPDCDHIRGIGLLGRNIINITNQSYEYLSEKIKSIEKRFGVEY